MKLIYDVEAKPKTGQIIVFALQQMLAILAATIAVPVIIGNGLTPAAAMFGAGVGTLVYLAFTKKKSPVFLGSSFAFIGSMSAAFAGAATMELGMLGIIIGAIAAGLVYVVIAALIGIVGVDWLGRLMPPVVIGPTVAIIGLSLAGNAIGDLQKSDVTDVAGAKYAALICGLITLAVTMLCSTYGKKMLRLVPFVMGILAGYAAAVIFTVIGDAADIEALKIIDQDIRALNLAVRRYKPVDENSIMEDFIKKYPELREAVYSSNIDIEEWKEAYERIEGYHPENLKHTAADGTRSRSKNEIYIASRLDHYGIIYRWDCPTGIPGLKRVPDYTILRVRDWKVLYWEHLGMMDVPEYRIDNKKKIEEYEKVGIVPWDNLILTYDTIGGGLRADLIEATIKGWLL